MCKSHYELWKIGSIRERVHCSNSELQFIELYTCTCPKNLDEDFQPNLHLPPSFVKKYKSWKKGKSKNMKKNVFHSTSESFLNDFVEETNVC